MAVATFPRPWPDFPRADRPPFVEAALDIVRRQAGGATGDRDFTIERGLPQWQGKWKTRGLSNAEIGVLRAFFDSMRGAARYFLLFDPLREFPLAYMPAGWPVGMLRADGSDWDGAGVLHAVDDSAVSLRDLVEIWSLPAGLVFSPGDYVSFIWSTDRYSLHRVLDAEGVIADDAGKAALWLEPELPDGIEAGVPAVLRRACAKWRLPVGQREVIAPAGSGGARPSDCSFQATSTLV